MCFLKFGIWRDTRFSLLRLKAEKVWQETTYPRLVVMTPQKEDLRDTFVIKHSLSLKTKQIWRTNQRHHMAVLLWYALHETCIDCTVCLSRSATVTVKTHNIQQLTPPGLIFPIGYWGTSVRSSAAWDWLISNTCSSDCHLNPKQWTRSTEFNFFLNCVFTESWPNPNPITIFVDPVHPVGYQPAPSGMGQIRPGVGLKTVWCVGSISENVLCVIKSSCLRPQLASGLMSLQQAPAAPTDTAPCANPGLWKFLRRLLFMHTKDVLAEIKVYWRLSCIRM